MPQAHTQRLLLKFLSAQLHNVFLQGLCGQPLAAPWLMYLYKSLKRVCCVHLLISSKRMQVEAAA